MMDYHLKGNPTRTRVESPKESGGDGLGEKGKTCEKLSKTI
jgi:hypothetical protein